MNIPNLKYTRGGTWVACPWILADRSRLLVRLLRDTDCWVRKAKDCRDPYTAFHLLQEILIYILHNKKKLTNFWSDPLWIRYKSWFIVFVLIKIKIYPTDCGHYGAVLEGISTVTRNACARRPMINDLALCVCATGARTWVLTFGTYTAQCRSTVSINDTFGAASFIRVADVISSTGTWPDAVLFFADCIETTRWWTTWGEIYGNNYNVLKKQFSDQKRIVQSKKGILEALRGVGEHWVKGSPV